MDFSVHVNRYLTPGTPVECLGTLRRSGTGWSVELTTDIPSPGPRLSLADATQALSSFTDGSRVHITAFAEPGCLRVRTAMSAGAATLEPRFQLEETYAGQPYRPVPYHGPETREVAQLLFHGRTPLAQEWVTMKAEDGPYLQYVVAYDQHAVRERLMPYYGDSLRVVPATYPADVLQTVQDKILAADDVNVESTGSRLGQDGRTVLTVRTVFPDAELEAIAQSVPGLVDYRSNVTLISA